MATINLYYKDSGSGWHEVTQFVSQVYYKAGSGAAADYVNVHDVWIKRTNGTWLGRSGTTVP